MKNFFASFLGSLVGVIVAGIILIIIFFAMVTASLGNLFAGKQHTAAVLQNSVLHITFDKPIKERTAKNPFEDFGFGDFSASENPGLNDILASISHAKNDSRIKGIYMDFWTVPAHSATIGEIRNAILDFKKSGKFVLAYSEIYTQNAYYLASAADKVYLNPEGIIEFKGLGGNMMFYKNMLEKLGIEAQIFRHGKFKAATEPLFLDKMSRENREQVHAYVGAIWNQLLKGVSVSRSIPEEELSKIADGLLIRNAKAAVDNKLADELIYKDEMLDRLRDLLKVKKNGRINFVSLGKYAHTIAPKDFLVKNKIAVIYAVGDIEGGEGDDETIGSERISKAIRQARTDSSVKAIVLRVNSPGGSSLASDVIWREVMLAKKEKPVVVSMGDVAASGGYYISCAADAIVAQPNTITGSIGVFGFLPNTQKFFNDKLGVTFDTVKTNRHSDFPNLYRSVDKEEGAIIQDEIEKIYGDFISKVAEGRNMNKAAVDSIGQGRVWSGTDALRLGLVDKLGGINDAIEFAAGKAKIKSYRILPLPRMKDPLEAFLKEVKDEQSEKIVTKELYEQYEQFRKVRMLMNMKGVLARMPFDIEIN